MRSRTLASALALFGIVALADSAAAHCEIPCGIYGDEMRILMLKEHITTVEKSMKSIDELGAKKRPVWNQLNRWIGNKEKHADEIQHIVTQYFMTQRVKAPAAKDSAATAKYTKQLTLLHGLLVSAMKMKQTTDLGHIASARKLVDDFAAAYFSPTALKHLKEHK